VSYRCDRCGERDDSNGQCECQRNKDRVETLEDQNAKLTAGMDQLIADKLRLLAANGTMSTALNMIAGPVRRTAEEMKELAKMGLTVATNATDRED